MEAFGHKHMRVGLDLTAIWRQPTGIFRYATELARHLVLLEESPSIRYVFFFAHEVHPELAPLQARFEAVICPSHNELLVKQGWFPLVLPGLRLDVMHYPAFPPPWLKPFAPACVMTLHDATPWRYPSTLTLHGRLYFRTLLKRGMQSCQRVITVSRHAKTEIMHFLGEHALAPVSVVPEAARMEFATPCSEPFKAQVRHRYRLPEHFLLAVATVEPRKNLVTLLDAYKQLKQQRGLDCPPLVIVGRKGWHCADILGYMAELEGSVCFPGHVADDELVALYQMASCLVFPSLYEGFGLPVLEAMLAGCPVITSRVSSLPEVAGDAGLLVDPLSAHEITAAMALILDDEQLRTHMICAGRQHAGQFSWELTACMTRDAYLLAANR